MKPTDEKQLEAHLRELKLGEFVANYADFARSAALNQASYTDFLSNLAEQEVQVRTARRRERRLKEAKLPLIKRFDSFDFTLIPSLNQSLICQLQDGRYLDAKQSVICIGAPGLGKTHIATALAVAACEQSRRVRFYNVAALVTLLTQAQEEGKLTAFLQRSLNEELIVLDELGFIPFSQSGARLMFQFCSALYEQVSLIVTTNLPFAQWTQVFGDEQLTVALLDRLTYRAHILEFVGNSHRLRERLSQKKEGTVDVASSPPRP